WGPTESSEVARYDTVPDESDDSEQMHSSLLSFDESDHPASVEMNRSLLELSEFDPLASSTPSQSNSLKPPSRPNSVSSGDSVASTTDANFHAAYPFTAGGPNQISLKFGERVLVLNKADTSGNPDWWLVANSSG